MQMSLSDKETFICYGSYKEPCYIKEDLKQALAELKETIKGGVFEDTEINKIIDKIFGDKLINQGQYTKQGAHPTSIESLKERQNANNQTALLDKITDTPQSNVEKSKGDSVVSNSKVIILDDNPLSMACYMEEHPEIDLDDCTHVAPKGEFKASVSSSVSDSKTNTVGCNKEIGYNYHLEGSSKTKYQKLGNCGKPKDKWSIFLCPECRARDKK